MVWLPDGEKNSEDMFTHIDRIHERDGRMDKQTDRQTLDDDGIGQAQMQALSGEKCTHV